MRNEIRESGRVERRRFVNANEAFISLVEEIHERPDHVVAPRGEGTREKLCVSLCITNPYDRCVTHPFRKFSLKYAIGEWLWYRRASNRLDEISHYSKFWNKVSDDAVTVNSAYGYRLFGKHPGIGINQWEFAKQELIRDMNSRRAIMMILSSFDLSHTTKDLPCTAYLQFFIRDDQLHLSVNMRSNDLVLGFANDIFAFTLFQEQMLCELRMIYPKLQMGMYFHFAGSMHVYERNERMITDIIQARDQRGSLRTLPHMDDLCEIDRLQQAEKSIRYGKKNIFSFTDPFCRACYHMLLDREE